MIFAHIFYQKHLLSPQSRVLSVIYTILVYCPNKLDKKCWYYDSWTPILVWLYSDKINSVVSNAFFVPPVSYKKLHVTVSSRKRASLTVSQKREYLTVSYKKWERIFNSFLEKICTFDSFLQKWECTFYSFLQKRMPIWQFLI